LFVKSPNGEEELLTKGMDGAKNRMASRRNVDKYAQEYETVKKVAVAIAGQTDVAVEIY
jgi:hypothetical protein